MLGGEAGIYAGGSGTRPAADTSSSSRHQVADEQSDQEQRDRVRDEHRESTTEVGFHIPPLVRFVVFCSQRVSISVISDWVLSQADSEVVAVKIASIEVPCAVE